jgi:hypothetical protein
MPLEDTEGFTQLALPQNQGGPVPHGLYVEFYLHPREDKERTIAEGRPIYVEKEYVRIMVPGDKSSIIERPVRLGDLPNMDNHKFGTEYATFKRGAEQGLIGTPLAEWPLMSRSQVKELEYFNVRTVEQLAGMADSNVQNFVGVANLRDQAKRFLDQAKEGAPLAQMQAELNQRDERLSAQDAAIAEMRRELAAMKGNALPPEAPAITEPDPTVDPEAAPKPKGKRKVAE